METGISFFQTGSLTPACSDITTEIDEKWDCTISNMQINLSRSLRFYRKLIAQIFQVLYHSYIYNKLTPDLSFPQLQASKQLATHK